jgi:hypothetical protein
MLRPARASSAVASASNANAAATHVAKNKGKDMPIPPLQSTVVINGDHATAYSMIQGTRKTGEAHFVDA